MDVAGGFQTALTFFDIELDRRTTGTIAIYSGLDGTGNQLASMTLPYTGSVFGAEESLSFSGVAHSVVFSGSNDDVGFDNIGFASAVPEPSTLILFASGLGAAWATRVLGRLRVRSRVGQYGRTR
jgi:hypothetical protein